MKRLSEEHKRHISESHRGLKPSKETLLKMSMAQKGKPREGLKTKFKKGHTTWNKGKKGIVKLSEETKKKIGDGHRGLRYRHWKMSEEKKKNMFRGRGKDSPVWKGGITPLNLMIRTSKEYKLWRKAVFARDNYTCIWCGVKDTTIQSDHIKKFADHPELRFAIDNGRTLCDKCHRTTDTYGNRTQRNEVENDIELGNLKTMTILLALNNAQIVKELLLNL